MEEMIARWIRETLVEYDRARFNKNLFKMNEMEILQKALRRMRESLLKSVT